jgi:hypothetical protein
MEETVVLRVWPERTIKYLRQNELLDLEAESIRTVGGLVFREELSLCEFYLWKNDLTEIHWEEDVWDRSQETKEATR